MKETNPYLLQQLHYFYIEDLDDEQNKDSSLEPEESATHIKVM